MEFRTFWFGKYKGKEICGIIASHTGYILWLYKDDIDIVVLSVEWGCYYCAFHTCDEDGWTLE